MLYHSSTPEAITKILNEGFRQIQPVNAAFLFSTRKVDYLGNFGIGTYAYLNNPRLSVFFIKKELRCSSQDKFKTLEFKLNKFIEENGKKRKLHILNLRPNSDDLIYFQDYVKRYSKNIELVLKNFEKVNGKSAVKRTGAIIEFFINNFKLDPDIVCGASITNDVLHIGIPDGIEYCIRNTKAIDRGSIRVI